jgi:putative lipase involved disintegration of autophagic bodies
MFPLKITPELAGKYALYAMMSSNAYHKEKRVRFPLETIGWTQVDRSGKATTGPTEEYWFYGLAYDIYEKQGADEVVFAIRGTDNIRDYLFANLAIPFSPQYKKLNKDFAEYIQTHPNKKVTAAGHSLGGGLALSASVHYGVIAITFDPSPRIFDGLGNHHSPAERIVIYEQGDPLQKAREHWHKISKVVSKDNFYECSVVPESISQHRGDYLALGLLRLGAEVNKDLTPILEALPPDP